MQQNNILLALDHINVSDLDYQEWINVGMALQSEGYDCSVWENWSRNDSRYHSGECEKKWKTFHGSSTPITGATICQMAMSRGWDPKEGFVMDWSDDIADDGDDFNSYVSPAPSEWDPVQDLITYLELLYEPTDIVGYVTNDAFQNDDGKWCPGKGAYDRTAAELIAGLKKHKDDIGATIGDCKPEAGAWIRFNPVDGAGVRNENVTSFKYALVESDSMSISDQDALYRKLELPIVTLTHSGGKSLHAIVRVDAPDYAEYRKRVEYLYDFLEKNGVVVDKQNRNPSRLSRMPGVMRGGNRQYLLATNIGRKSWADFCDFAEGVADELPDVVSLDTYKNNPPPLPLELIYGILRVGHKMLISGSSKAGKSFLLMELCVCIAEGAKWLGFKCRKGRVLYINLEIDGNSCINRFLKIYEALGLPPDHMDDIMIWNLRGMSAPLDKLVPKIIRRLKQQHYDAVVIDPIYKTLTGDENNASDMANFCNQFDRICAETGCSTIYCHHHSKGAQGGKRAMDRASGSGVFARDPDAQLDMIELSMSDDVKNNIRDGNSTAWRLESSLREFPNITPVNFWFEYPIHKIDTSGELAALDPDGSSGANLSKSSKRVSEDDRKESIQKAYEALSFEQPVTVASMAEYLGVTEKTVRTRIAEVPDQFFYKQGHVFPADGNYREENGKR